MLPSKSNCVMMCVPLDVISSLLLHLKKIVVSSAKIRKCPKLHALWRLFMYSMNSSGPRTEPWGTPQLICRCSDLCFPIWTYCFLSVR